MIQPIRPYEPGEDMTGISVYDGDVLEEGGGVAYNPNNLKDQWYISKQFMANYEEVPSD